MKCIYGIRNQIFHEAPDPSDIKGRIRAILPLLSMVCSNGVFEMVNYLRKSGQPHITARSLALLLRFPNHNHRYQPSKTPLHLNCPFGNISMIVPL